MTSWKRTKLGEVAFVQSGAQVGRNGIVDPVDMPYLRVANVQDGYLDLREIKTIKVEASQVSRYRLCTGDILMTEGGDADKLGRGHIWQGQVDPCLHQNHIFAVRVDRDCLMPEFLAAYLTTSAGKTYFLRAAKQTTNLATINTSQLRAMPLLLPPLPEQKAILKVLGATQGAVATIDALIEKQLVRKKTLVEELVTGRRRFPGPTAPWREHKLEEFVASKDERAPCDHPVILSCSKVHGILRQKDRFSRQLASVDHRHYKHVVPGDLVYDPMLLWDASISFTDLEGVVSPAYETLSWRDDSRADRRFFKALFQSDKMQQEYKRISQGTNARRRKAPVTDFLRVTLPLPDPEEQRRIADVLSTMDDEISLLRKQRDALNAQKKGLMQKLLTGEVRLKEFRD